MTVHSEGLPGFLRRQTAADRADSVDADHASQTESITGGSLETEYSNSLLDQAPVVVWEAAHHMEAQIVKGRLESEDIPALIRGEALGQIYGFTSGGLAATDVLVPAPLADKAIDILSTEVSWVDFDDEDGENK